MKTIIELPDNLPPNGIGLALRAIADDILIGAVVPVPPFCYCVDTAVGVVTFWDSESDTLRDPTAVGNQTHPPLGTTLADFTAAMLDALPVGSRFDEANTNGGVLEKCPDGWRYIDGSRCECVGFPDGYNGDRPLIRVGPEQASESAPSAPLPDPWPGYLVAFTYADVTRRHAIRGSATVNGETVFCPAGGFSEDVYLDWTPDVVQEVRTPDGTTLWKRPAGGAS